MNIYAKVRNLSINKKIFLSMAAISTIIIFTILAATFSIIFAVCMNLQTTSSIKDLNHISNQIDFYLSSVDNYSKTIIVNSTVQDLTNKFNTKYQQFNELDTISLKDEINKIIQSTEFIYAVNIYSISRQLIASTEITSNQKGIKEIEINKNRIWLSSQKKSPYANQKPIPVLMMLQKFYSHSTGKQLGYIEISIPETSISAIYKANPDGNYNTICIVNHNGSIQSTDGYYPVNTLYPFFKQINTTKTSGYSFSKKEIIFYKYYQKLNWYIISQVDSNIFLQPIYTLAVISVIIAICGIVISILLSKRISQAITSPIYKLVEHIQKVIQGQWTPLTAVSEQTEIGFLLNKFNDMLEAQNKLTDNLIKEQKMIQKLSLDLLQEQVNPHFLYNTLDNICSLAEIGELNPLIDVVMNLSRFYRKTLSKGSLVVKVEDELSITQAYLNIMHIRCFNKFEYSINCPEHLKQYPCLKLLLQPIVENSIYHGFEEISRSGCICINISESGNDIVFTVCDNGTGITEERITEIWQGHNSSFGIKNVDQRIKLYYGNDYGLKIEQNKDNGCTVTIKIAKEIQTA